MVRPQRQGVVVVGQRFLVPAKRGKRVAAIAARVEVAWRQRERPLVACQCLRMTAEILEREASVIVSGGVPGPHRQHLLKGGKRFLVAFERVKNDAVVGERVRRSGSRLERGGNQAQGLD